MAGDKPAHVRRALDSAAQAEVAQKLNARVAVAFFFKLIEMRVMVLLQGHADGDRGLDRVGLDLPGIQLQARLLKIPFAQRDRVADDALAQVGASHRGRIHLRARAGVETQQALAADPRASLPVREAEHVAIFGMLEIEIEPLLLAQPGDEMQGRLAVLHAVLARCVVKEAFEGKRVAGEILILEHLLDDPRHAQVLEDAVIRDQPEEPQARDQDGAIVGARMGGVQLGELADHAVHMPHTSAFVGDAQAGGLAEDLGEIDVWRFVNELDFKFVGLVDLFSPGEGVDPKTLRRPDPEGETPSVWYPMLHVTSLRRAWRFFRSPCQHGGSRDIQRGVYILGNEDNQKMGYLGGYAIGVGE